MALGSIAGAFGLTAIGARRAAGTVVVAGLVKATRTGRAAFTSELHRTLIKRRAVLLDRRVLTRFEQVDFVVVDEASLTTADVEAVTSLLDHRDIASRSVGLGASAYEAIRDAQADGRVVAALTHDPTALAHADCGVAIRGDGGGAMSWHADLVVPASELPLVVDAFPAARAAAHRSLALGLAGSGIGAVVAATGRGQAARAATSAVNVASLAAIGLGTWDARRLSQLSGAMHTRGASVPWHALAVDDVFDRLESSARGLDARDAAGRPVNRTSDDDENMLDVVGAELANPLTPVLSGGAGLSELPGFVGVFHELDLVVVGNAAIGVAQRVQTQRAVRELETASETPVVVRRDGADSTVPATELVIGDVVVLARGDIVPADCRVIESRGGVVDESGLTGESFPSEKVAAPDPRDTFVADRHSMLFAGTTIVAGEFVGVVVAVGDDTQAAQALVIGDHARPPSGVERRLAEITRITVPIALGGAALLSANALLRGHPLRETVTTGVGLLAAAIPEGLPLVATTAQLGAARRLSERDAIVRAPRTIEALGRVDVLGFDKTGTLTDGRVAVHAVATASGVEELDALSENGREVLVAAMRATAAHTDGNGDGSGNGNGNGNGGANSGILHVHGADRAVAEAVHAVGLDLPDWSVAAELPFEHERSFHASRIVEAAATRLAVKGAPETLLPRCTTWRGAPEATLDAAARARASAQVEDLAAQGFRVLAIAERPGTGRPELEEGDVHNLELVGFVALADTVRDTASAAVKALRGAGVDIVMITGDHPRTAEAVARELGVLDGRRVLTGTALDEMSDDELDEAVGATAVYARVTPADKARIVESLQRMQRVVAMTGDGTNDAAAIRRADVGVALGGRATPAARHAADVVVTDDRLETIIAAIIEGRAMWSSVRDALSILLGGNLGELSYALIVGGVMGSSPLNARQTLLVNLLTDLLPAAAIASRPPRHLTPEALLDAGPDVALGSALTDEVITRAISTCAGATAAWAIGRATGRRRRANTIGLVALVGTQLGQTVLTGGADPLVVGSMVASTAALVGVVQTPVVSQFFGCTPLGPMGWTVATGAATAGTAMSVGLPWMVRSVRARVSGHGETRHDDLAEQPLGEHERELGKREGEQFLHQILR